MWLSYNHISDVNYENENLYTGYSGISEQTVGTDRGYLRKQNISCGHKTRATITSFFILLPLLSIIYRTLYFLAFSVFIDRQCAT